MAKACRSTRPMRSTEPSDKIDWHGVIEDFENANGLRNSAVKNNIKNIKLYQQVFYKLSNWYCNRISRGLQAFDVTHRCSKACLPYMHKIYQNLTGCSLSGIVHYCSESKECKWVFLSPSKDMCCNFTGKVLPDFCVPSVNNKKKFHSMMTEIESSSCDTSYTSLPSASSSSSSSSSSPSNSRPVCTDFVPITSQLAQTATQTKKEKKGEGEEEEVGIDPDYCEEEGDDTNKDKAYRSGDFHSYVFNDMEMEKLTGRYPVKRKKKTNKAMVEDLGLCTGQKGVIVRVDNPSIYGCSHINTGHVIYFCCQNDDYLVDVLLGAIEITMDEYDNLYSHAITFWQIKSSRKLETERKKELIAQKKRKESISLGYVDRLVKRRQKRNNKIFARIVSGQSSPGGGGGGGGGTATASGTACPAEISVTDPTQIGVTMFGNKGKKGKLANNDSSEASSMENYELSKSNELAVGESTSKVKQVIVDNPAAVTRLPLRLQKYSGGGGSAHGRTLLRHVLVRSATEKLAEKSSEVAEGEEKKGAEGKRTNKANFTPSEPSFSPPSSFSSSSSSPSSPTTFESPEFPIRYPPPISLRRGSGRQSTTPTKKWDTKPGLRHKSSPILHYKQSPAKITRSTPIQFGIDESNPAAKVLKSGTMNISSLNVLRGGTPLNTSSMGAAGISNPSTPAGTPCKTPMTPALKFAQKSSQLLTSVALHGASALVHTDDSMAHVRKWPTASSPESIKKLSKTVREETRTLLYDLLWDRMPRQSISVVSKVTWKLSMAREATEYLMQCASFFKKEDGEEVVSVPPNYFRIHEMYMRHKRRATPKTTPSFDNSIQMSIQEYILKCWMVLSREEYSADRNKKSASLFTFVLGLLYTMAEGGHSIDGVNLVPAVPYLKTHLPTLEDLDTLDGSKCFLVDYFHLRDKKQATLIDVARSRMKKSFASNPPTKPAFLGETVGASKISAIPATATTTTTTICNKSSNRRLKETRTVIRPLINSDKGPCLLGDIESLRDSDTAPGSSCYKVAKEVPIDKETEDVAQQNKNSLTLRISKKMLQANGIYPFGRKSQRWYTNKVVQQSKALIKFLFSQYTGPATLENLSLYLLENLSFDTEPFSKKEASPQTFFFSKQRASTETLLPSGPTLKRSSKLVPLNVKYDSVSYKEKDKREESSGKEGVRLDDVIIKTLEEQNYRATGMV